MQESIDERTNILNDRRVLLSLDVDDIKNQCIEKGIDFEKVNVDEVFRLHRKYMESDHVMEIYWETLDDAINESVVQ